jgi:hypothetical protein
LWSRQLRSFVASTSDGLRSLIPPSAISRLPMTDVVVNHTLAPTCSPANLPATHKELLTPSSLNLSSSILQAEALVSTSDSGLSILSPAHPHSFLITHHNDQPSTFRSFSNRTNQSKCVPQSSSPALPPPSPPGPPPPPPYDSFLCAALSSH